MFNPFKLYLKSQEVQLNWIRNHPFQWLALNATIAAGFFGYMEYKDRQWMKEIETENTESQQEEVKEETP